LIKPSHSIKGGDSIPYLNDAGTILKVWWKGSMDINIIKMVREVWN